MILCESLKNHKYLRTNPQKNPSDSIRLTLSLVSSINLLKTQIIMANKQWQRGCNVLSSHRLLVSKATTWHCAFCRVNMTAQNPPKAWQPEKKKRSKFPTKPGKQRITQPASDSHFIGAYGCKTIITLHQKTQLCCFLTSKGVCVSSAMVGNKIRDITILLNRVPFSGEKIDHSRLKKNDPPKINPRLSSWNIWLRPLEHKQRP